MNDIHDFAVKYYGLYSNRQTTETEVEMGFDDLCFGFGFEMDCGKRFGQTFSVEAFCNTEELEKVVGSIRDVSLLGSAIFSKWRAVTHWDNAPLLREDHRAWFSVAFKRLAEITE